MWEIVGQVLKIFLEKHFLTTVISVAVAILALLYLPSDYWMIVKLGSKLFVVLVSCVVFVIIRMLAYMKECINNITYKNAQDEELAKARSKEEAKAIDEWLSYMDKLSPSERNLVLAFVKSGNKPIIENGHCHHSYDSIYYTNLIVQMENANGSKSVKLSEPFYNVMKDIYETRGSLTHFD